MTSTVPLFPLNAVLFPGARVPLHVFEERYRRLVARLLEEEDPSRRRFASVAIREGFEVSEHGARSLYQVGVMLRLTEAERLDDGGYRVEARVQQRVRLHDWDLHAEVPQGSIDRFPEPEEEVPEEVVHRARATFTAYRARLLPMQQDPHPGALPDDTSALAWTLSAVSPLPLPERQDLLEIPGTTDRLRRVTALLRGELQAMNVIPSLPATEIDRTGWSPN